MTHTFMYTFINQKKFFYTTKFMIDVIYIYNFAEFNVEKRKTITEGIANKSEKFIN